MDGVSNRVDKDILRMHKFTGYHGTKLSTAKTIIQTKRFVKSKGDDHWLGFGIYFFLDTDWVQWWWGKKCFPENNRGCVVCGVSVSDKYLLDITTLDGQEKLQIANDLAKAYSEKLGLTVEKGISDGEAINHLAQKIHIRVVIGEFSIRNDEYSNSRLLRKKQIQVSVRDERCIESIQMCTI